MTKPKPHTIYHLWPDSATGKAVGHLRMNFEWSDEHQGWMAWREDEPGYRIVLHGWEKTEAVGK